MGDFFEPGGVKQKAKRDVAGAEKWGAISPGPQGNPNDVGAHEHRPHPHGFLLIPSLASIDAGCFSYTAGLFGAAISMALAVGPGWLGFIVAFVPASLLASWVVASDG